MSEVAIRVEGLSKKYHIAAVRDRYRTLRDDLADGLAAPWRRAKKLLRGQATGAAELDVVIWALKGVSFEVARGEVVGIIGRNGAGKTTLLKVLSRITEPTEGFAEIRGRVGSLLEVGTGFHPELTGRENVYLNGAILGMRRAEIDRRFDEIVAFAEIEKFIDTPVKHYSSGMYVRLAFSVAAHLEPEILFVDEVLSVGDAGFRKKSLGKLSDVAVSGRTVLFVSHNLGAITELCDRAIMIEDGRIVRDGAPASVVSEYLCGEASHSGVWTRPPAGDGEKGAVTVQSVRVLSEEGGLAPVVPFDQGFQIEIRYQIHEPVRDLVVACGVKNDLGTHLWSSWDTDGTELSGRVRESGEYTSTCSVPPRLLRPGRYSLSISTTIPKVKRFESHSEITGFEVSSVGYQFNPSRHGVMTPLLDWRVARSRVRDSGLTGA